MSPDILLLISENKLKNVVVVSLVYYSSTPRLTLANLPFNSLSSWTCSLQSSEATFGSAYFFFSSQFPARVKPVYWSMAQESYPSLSLHGCTLFNTLYFLQPRKVTSYVDVNEKKPITLEDLINMIEQIKIILLIIIYLTKISYLFTIRTIFSTTLNN